MAKITLKDGEYTFDASAKTITLASPYNTLNQGQVESISDLTTHDDIFKVGSRKHPITLSGAVITHSYNNPAQADTDKLQIVIDTELAFTDADEVLFENDVIQPNDIGTSKWIPIEGVPSLNLYLASIVAFTWNVEFTDDPAANADGYEYCGSSDTVILYTTLGKGTNPVVAGKKCIQITNIKASQFRLIAENTGATPEAPYAGVK